jgi:hypothetical protein
VVKTKAHAAKIQKAHSFKLNQAPTIRGLCVFLQEFIMIDEMKINRAPLLIPVELVFVT